MSASDIIIVTLGLQQEYLGAPAVAAKGFALTVREVDSNFFNLKQGVIDLDLSKAPLASPTFTGVPTAPTPSTGTNTTQLATTAFVQTGLNNLNTSISNQFSAVNEESSDLSALINTLTEEKAPINSPIFTGTVFFGNTALYQLLPSFSSTDSSNNAVPSVSYVKDKLSNLTQTVKPSILNTVNLGSSTNPFLNLFLQGNIIPYTTDTQDIGTPTKRFKDLYLSGNTLILGEANISSSLEGGVILPLNTSIGDENNIIPTNFASTTIHEAFAKTTQTTTLRLSFTASGSIVAGSPVAINSDGTISTVNSNTAPNTSFIGIAESSAVSGNEASIAISGPVNNLSSLVTNENVFLNTDGTLTNIKSATNVKIGIATSSTEMFVFTTTGIDIYALNTSKIKLTDLSIGADNTPLNLGGISYDNTTGEFTYTPVDLGSYATTSYVDTAVANLVDSAPESLNTLNELSAALNDDANFATTITTSIGLKAPLASPTFTGVPAAPTAVSGTNTTQLATTEFVQSAVGGSISLSSLSIGVDNPASGTGGITYNSSTGVFNFTPADLTAYATLASPTFTGTPTAPTATTGTNTTQLATTAFVQSQIDTSTLKYSDFSAAVALQSAGTGSLAYDNTTGTFTYTPPFLQFSDLNNTPTTLSGYGIVGDIDIGSSDFITTGKAYFANVFATIEDLPSAATYHGMFAHVHATGAGYFAHAGNWIEIGNKSYVDSELSLKAPLASPTFTGVPVAPTATTGTNTTQIATTEFVQSEIFVKAPLASPTFTGVPAAPTATTGTNTTQIATTAFVQTELAGLGGGNTSITISDNSPLSPSSGDLWFNSTNLTAYVYYNDGDSAQWMPVSPASGGGGGGASVTVDTTAPSSVSSGDLWFNSTNLTAYIYYNDGDSSQWVPVFPGTAGGGSGGASVTVSDTAPISPSEGDLWYNSEYGELLIYLGNAWAAAVAITPAESSWTSTTAAVTLFAGQKVLVDTSASAITLTLPASPSLGNEVRIIDATGNSATNNITVARNGSNIMGLAEDFIINIDEAAFGLVYFNASRGWVLTEK